MVNLRHMNRPALGKFCTEISWCFGTIFPYQEIELINILTYPPSDGKQPVCCSIRTWTISIVDGQPQRALWFRWFSVRGSYSGRAEFRKCGSQDNARVLTYAIFVEDRSIPERILFLSYEKWSRQLDLQLIYQCQHFKVFVISQQYAIVFLAYSQDGFIYKVQGFTLKNWFTSSYRKRLFQ